MNVRTETADKINQIQFPRFELVRFSSITDCSLFLYKWTLLSSILQELQPLSMSIQAGFKTKGIFMSILYVFLVILNIFQDILKNSCSKLFLDILKSFCSPTNSWWYIEWIWLLFHLNLFSQTGPHWFDHGF